MLNENEYFETSDFALITALCCLGYSIASVDRRNGSRAVFFVLRDRFLDEHIQGYWSHSLLIDPLQYFHTLKEVKTRLYQTG